MIAKDKDTRKHTPSMFDSGQFCYICSKEFTKEDKKVYAIGEYPCHPSCFPEGIVRE